MISQPSPWRSPPENLLLKREQVHVWRASLIQPSVDSFRDLLDPKERDRADRFHFQKDRDRFIIARGILRDVLSRYLAAKPGELRFSYGKYDKPELAAGSGDDSLRFNLSHSADLALYGVARDREIGIDVEEIRAGLEIETIAEQFFSPEEVKCLGGLPSNQRPEGFFTCWVRKEAYLKGRGLGLQLPTNQFEVSLVPGEPAALLKTTDGSEANWCLQEVPLDPEYVAAVAVQGSQCELVCWQW